MGTDSEKQQTPEKAAKAVGTTKYTKHTKI